MAKPRPVEVHVNSKGVKHLKLQELIYDEETYYFLPINGQQKTELYNKGLLDGRKRAVVLFERYSDCCFLASSVLALPRSQVERDLNRRAHFIGVIPLNQTYLMDTRETGRFVEDICYNCENYGRQGCFLEQDYDCGEEDRERFRDTPHLMRQKSIRKERRKKDIARVTGWVND